MIIKTIENNHKCLVGYYLRVKKFRDIFHRLYDFKVSLYCIQSKKKKKFSPKIRNLNSSKKRKKFIYPASCTLIRM